MSLSPDQIERFVHDGFVRIDNAFARDLAAECRIIIDRAAGVTWDDPSTWRAPVIRLPGFYDPPFLAAVSTPKLHEAWTQLIGVGNWSPLKGVGTFVLRFFVPGEVLDDGWHIDVSFAGPESDPNDFMTWRANIVSRGRGLLMLMLFTDVGEDDAPTRIRIGSHLFVARRLEPHGEAGLSLADLAQEGFDDSKHCPEALATGEAGTVYLCHPLLVHAAQRNMGGRARYLAQPPLPARRDLQLNRADGKFTPVERAVLLGLGR